jgi:flagellar biosynthetic protein FliP
LRGETAGEAGRGGASGICRGDPPATATTINIRRAPCFGDAPPSGALRAPVSPRKRGAEQGASGTLAKRLALHLGIIALGAVVASGAAYAQSVSIDLGGGEGLTGRLVQLILVVTLLSVAPSILIMTTSFVRIVVVLSLLRTAIGLQQSPPNTVIVSLALFLTAFIMANPLTEAWQQGVQPMMNDQMGLEEGFTRASAPIKTFMLAHTREDDLAMFFELSKTTPPATAAETPLQVLIPSFMISELRRAFEIGFMIFLPFLIIDLVVASLLMAMGMMMLPPVTISLPFKLIFFVLVDGWRLIAGSLAQSYGM